MFLDFPSHGYSIDIRSRPLWVWPKSCILWAKIIYRGANTPKIQSIKV